MLGPELDRVEIFVVIKTRSYSVKRWRMLIAAVLALLAPGIGETSAAPGPAPGLFPPSAARGLPAAPDAITDPLAGMAPLRAHRIQARIPDPARSCIAAGSIERDSPLFSQTNARSCASENGLMAKPEKITKHDKTNLAATRVGDAGVSPGIRLPSYWSGA